MKTNNSTEQKFYQPIDRIKEEILKTLNEKGIRIKRIILFGSRARGEATTLSDYDLLIITEKTFPIGEKMSIAKAVRKALSELLVPSDVIINSEEEVEITKDRIGCITRYAIKEGIVIYDL
jgi:predicted nucleotidyltransferase